MKALLRNVSIILYTMKNHGNTLRKDMIRLDSYFKQITLECCGTWIVGGEAILESRRKIIAAFPQIFQ